MHTPQLAPKGLTKVSYTALPSRGLSNAETTAVLDQLADLPNTKWETGRVSGAVYHGGEEMAQLWKEAFGKFEVSNPLHADVFPGKSHGGGGGHEKSTLILYGTRKNLRVSSRHRGY